MSPRRWIAPAALAALAAALALPGCTRDDGPLPELGDRLPVSARRVLEGAETFELVALEGDAPGAGSFHGWKETGRLPLAAAERHKLLYALYGGIAGNDDKLAACFRPNAAVHATRGAETVDLLLSFDCMLVHVYEGGRLFTALTTREAKGPVGRVFTRAGARF